MTLRQRTALYLSVPAALLLAWDIFVAANDVKDDTISELLRDLGTAVYTLPFLFGIVMGHLFENSDTRPNRFKMLFPVAIAVVLLDITGYMHYPGGNFIFFTFGVGFGAYLWPQKMAK